MSYELVIDTSREFIMLGLIKDEGYVFKRVDVGREISKYLLNELILFLDENSCDKSKIVKIYCGRGPGAFTGIRLALSVAKTMSYALNTELYSFSSILFYNLFVENRKVIGIDDARSYKYYYGFLDKDDMSVYEGVDEDPDVVEYCDLRDDCLVVSTREFINISTKIISDFSYFDIECFKELSVLEDYYTFKPKYIKKIDSEV